MFSSIITDSFQIKGTIISDFEPVGILSSDSFLLCHTASLGAWASLQGATHPDSALEKPSAKRPG
jgi:hypothetical protein